MTKNAAIPSWQDDEGESRIEKDLVVGAADFVGALAALLRGSVDRLGETAGRVTGTLLERADKTDRDLVVALQDFDRLQQEFAALSRALTHSADALRESSSANPASKPVGRAAIAAIAVSDLLARLSSHLQSAARSESTIGLDDEKIF
jgi:hypothetical protein